MSLHTPLQHQQLPVLHKSEEGARPVPGRPPLLTPARQAAFCEALSQHGNVRLACRALGISSQTAYRARRSSASMRACWDAALVIARTHVEEVLADRAINGVEESVYYHGEEVAVRRRFDSRLLLAHLARLDAHAVRVSACAACDAPLEPEAGFDDALARLGEREVLPSGLCSICSKTRGDEAGDEAGDGEDVGEDVGEEDPIPPCEDCGGLCYDDDADLTPDDCMWLGNRLDRMDAARPHGAQEPHQLCTGEEEDSGATEMRQLTAFENGAADWWLIITEADLQAALAALYGSGWDGPEAGDSGAQSDCPPTSQGALKGLQ